MGFKKVKIIGEGTYIVKVIGVDIKTCKNENQVLILRLISTNKEQGVFGIFINNSYLIEKLIKITYENYDEVEDIDEEDFIDIRMKVKVKEKNGYLNIVDIIDLNPRSN